MTEKLVTHLFKTHAAQQIVESVAEGDSTYYIFAAGHIPYVNDDAVVLSPNNSPDNLEANVYQNMIFGKLISNADVVLMAKRHDWETNTVYTMYEQDNPDLFSNNFYVTVDEGSFYHTFKCLYNNNGNPSTVKPSFGDSTQDSNLFDDNDGYYGTSDGYQWKYLFTTTQQTFDKFATLDYIPVVANTVVSNSAVDGSIDVIKVVSGGSRYDNYFAGIFSVNDIKVTSNASALSSVSSDRMYSLGDNTTVANSSGSVAVVANQSNITGTSTTFTTDFKLGDFVKVANTLAHETKQIISITNNTVMAVSGNFSNTFTGANIALCFPYAASANQDFYNNCVIKIVAGTGVGQYKKITDYVNDGYKKIIVIEDIFTVDPDSTSEYEISPFVKVVGNGTETINCEARALVNAAAANSIYKIEILNNGKFYKRATANVLFSNVISISNTAVLKPIIPPLRGHGYDVFHDVGATALGVSVKFANTESDTISAENDFRSVGIIKDVLFSNVEITTTKKSDGSSGSDGTFLVGERIYQLDLLKLAGNVSINTSANTLIGTGTDFTGLRANDIVVVNSGNNWFASNVSSIASATNIVVSTNGTFVNTDAYIYKAKKTAEAYVDAFASPQLLLANVVGFFTTNSQIIGLSSYATANVSNVAINNIEKTAGFTTFSQLSFVTGTLTSGVFVEDEVIYQTNTSVASARFHSISSANNKLYFTNEMGVINASGTLIGQNSGAVFTITNKYHGDLVYGSGQVVYIQTSEAVARSNAQTENVKIIVEF